MIIKKNQILTATNKKPILYDVYFNPIDKPQPLVIFCHGYKGFKDWGPWHLVAEAFAAAGFCFVKMNFSHNGGTVENPIDFPDPAAFAENNFSLELDDLDRMIEKIESGSPSFPHQIASLSLIGHSRGGGIVLIKASEDQRIDKVVTWASVSDFKPRFQEGTEAFENWKSTGITYIENSRTGQMLPHNFQFYEDFKRNEERFTIKRAIEQVNVPLLIVHGSDDPTVPVKEAHKLHNWNPQSELCIIDEGDHVFNAKHPWNSDEMPKALQEAVLVSAKFLGE